MKLLGEYLSQWDIEVQYQEPASIPVVETPPSYALIQATVDAVAGVTGRVPRVAGFTGGTEAAILAPAFELPFVICGPGNLAVAHQVNEWVDMSELEAAAMTYTLLAELARRQRVLRTEEGTGWLPPSSKKALRQTIKRGAYDQY
jgi:acetylornithine deacetylase/succinyl-diaminopimelate desuccinylase-like protein